MSVALCGQYCQRKKQTTPNRRRNIGHRIIEGNQIVSNVIEKTPFTDTLGLGVLSLRGANRLHKYGKFFLSDVSLPNNTEI